MDRWFIDGNNVFGSRPDGWWNDRAAAMGRFAQAVAVWCRTDAQVAMVTLVFDPPVPASVIQLGGGNLVVRAADRSGRDAADDTLVRMVAELAADESLHPPDEGRRVTVVTSDRRLRRQLDDLDLSIMSMMGAGTFRELIGY